jgi:flagellar protein FlbD
MIVLHRLGHAAEPFYLSPELIVTVEANPDTVVTLTTGTKIVVHEAPEVVVERIRHARVGVLVEAAQVRDDDRDNDRPHAAMRRLSRDVFRVLEERPQVVEAS